MKYWISSMAEGTKKKKKTSLPLQVTKAGYSGISRKRSGYRLSESYELKILQPK